MNSVNLIGRLTRDPDLRYSPSGLAMTRMTLAVDKNLYGEKKQQAIQAGKPTADFISIVVFGKSAENAANFLAKGRQCAVLGRIQTGSYVDKDGNKRYTTDVVADRVEFIGNKGDSGSMPGKEASSDSSFFDGVNEDDQDIFQATDDGEIPF